MGLVLRNTFVVREIKQKTKAEFFKDLRVGDILYLTIPITNSAGAGSYAPHVSILCNRTNDRRDISMNNLSNVLKSFVLDEPF